MRCACLAEEAGAAQRGRGLAGEAGAVQRRQPGLTPALRLARSNSRDHHALKSLRDRTGPGQNQGVGELRPEPGC